MLIHYENRLRYVLTEDQIKYILEGRLSGERLYRVKELVDMSAYSKPLGYVLMEDCGRLFMPVYKADFNYLK